MSNRHEVATPARWQLVQEKINDLRFIAEYLEEHALEEQLADEDNEDDLVTIASFDSENGVRSEASFATTVDPVVFIPPPPPLPVPQAIHAQPVAQYDSDSDSDTSDDGNSELSFEGSITQEAFYHVASEWTLQQAVGIIDFLEFEDRLPANFIKNLKYITRCSCERFWDVENGRCVSCVKQVCENCSFTYGLKPRSHPEDVPNSRQRESFRNRRLVGTCTEPHCASQKLPINLLEDCRCDEGLDAGFDRKPFELGRICNKCVRRTPDILPDNVAEVEFLDGHSEKFLLCARGHEADRRSGMVFCRLCLRVASST
ncbi:hypothetical protein B0J14DRAFT_705272 [Halenospora varia]|nr:hypothetical protein B0J14DRAFT_705272 [Halenospora varia]